MGVWPPLSGAFRALAPVRRHGGVGEFGDLCPRLKKVV